MQDVAIKVPSHNLTKALLYNSYDGTPSSYLLPTQAEPTEAQVAPVAGQNFIPGSSWPAGKDGSSAPNRLFIQPYCEGPEGSQFWMRLYGWRWVGTAENQRVWIPSLVIQLFCMAGNLPGPTIASGTALVQTENLCDTIGVAAGSPGPSGEIVAMGPGSQFAAFAEVELRGFKKFSFEFEQGDNVGMNALWAPC